MNTCSDCKYWTPQENTGIVDALGAGRCAYAVDGYEAEEWNEDAKSYKLKPEHVGIKVFVLSDYKAELLTLPDFGCNQWEQK